jgi:tetratricopeptide (TPR) repeat protein
VSPPIGDLESRLRAALADRYFIERELGRGGMATVYLARDQRHERLVALKVLRPELAAVLGPERFLREIRIAAGLSHPHILPLFDSGEAAGCLYYVMPYVAGESLRDRLNRAGQLPLDEALLITREVADALGHAHAKGLIHRDIKPENILLDAGHAMVADFGVARAVDAAGRDSLTETGLAVGTPSYMSPEQAGAEPRLEGTSDLYSLGCVAYEMLSGTPPFTGPTPRSVLARHAVDPVPPLRTLRPGVPPPVEAAIEKMLAKNPADRFATAAEFLAALNTPAGTASTRAVPAVTARPPLSRTFRRAAAGVIVLAALIVAALLWRRRTAPAPVSSTAVAVLPFSVNGTDSLGLSEGMVSLLSTKLDGAGDLRAVDPRALLSYVKRESGGTLDPETGRGIAGHFGAGLYVMGDLLDIGGRLQLSAAVYDANGKSLATASVDGQADQLFQLVDSLTTKLLAGWSGRASRLAGLASLTTSSLPALKAYLEGDVEFRAGHFGRAVEAYQRATAADSTFALAWYRLTIAAEWLTREQLAVESAEAALRHADHLPPRERLLLRGMLARRRGQADSAEAAFRRILSSSPEDVEAWVQLGESQFHLGPWWGRPPGEAREAWTRVSILDPGLIASPVHLARIAAGERRLAELDSLLRQIVVAQPSVEADRPGATRDPELELTTLQAFAHGDSAAEESALARLASASDLTAVLSAMEVTLYSGNLDGSRQVTSVLTTPDRSTAARAIGHVALAYIAAGMGQFKRAEAELDRVRSFDPELAVETGVMLAITPLREADTTRLRALRGELGKLSFARRPIPPEEATWFSAGGHYRPWIGRYLAGVLDAQLGQEGQALQAAEELDRSASQAPSPAEVANLANGVRAEVARRHGFPPTMPPGLAPLHLEVDYLTAMPSPVLALARPRWLLAEALAKNGRPDDALTWYASVGQFSNFEVFLVAPSHLRQAQLLEQLGRRAEAARHYATFAQLWKDADPEYVKLVADARAKANTLQ